MMRSAVTTNDVLSCGSLSKNNLYVAHFVALLNSVFFFFLIFFSCQTVYNMLVVINIYLYLLSQIVKTPLFLLLLFLFLFFCFVFFGGGLLSIVLIALYAEES